MANDIIYTGKVDITRQNLEGIVEVLNRYRFPETPLLTIEEILNNPRLKEYICAEAVADSLCIYDPLEAFSGDAWADWEDYRN